MTTSAEKYIVSENVPPEHIETHHNDRSDSDGVPSPKSVATSANVRTRRKETSPSKAEGGKDKGAKSPYDSKQDPFMQAYWKRQEEVRQKLRDEAIAKAQGKSLVSLKRSGTSSCGNSLTSRGSGLTSVVKKYSPQQPLHEHEAACLRCFAPPGSDGRISLTVAFDATRGIDLTWLARQKDYREGWFQPLTKSLPELCAGNTQTVDSPRSIIILFRNGVEVPELLPREPMSFRRLTDDLEHVKDVCQGRCEAYDAKRKEIMQQLLLQYNSISSDATQNEILDIVFETKAHAPEDVHGATFQQRVERDSFIEDRRQNLVLKYTNSLKTRQRNDQMRQIELERQLSERKVSIKQEWAEKAKVKAEQLEVRRSHSESLRKSSSDFVDSMRQKLEEKYEQRAQKVEKSKEVRRNHYHELCEKQKSKSVHAREFQHEKEEERYHNWEEKAKELELHEQRFIEKKLEQELQLQEERKLANKKLWITNQRAKAIQEAQIQAVVESQRSAEGKISELKDDQAKHIKEKRKKQNQSEELRLQRRLEAKVLEERQRDELLAKQARTETHQEDVRKQVTLQQHQKHEADLLDSVEKERERQRRIKQLQYEQMVTLTSMHLKSSNTEGNKSGLTSLVRKTKHFRDRLRISREEFQNKVQQDLLESRKEMFLGYYNELHPKPVFPDILQFKKKVEDKRRVVVVSPREDRPITSQSETGSLPSASTMK